MVMRFIFKSYFRCVFLLLFISQITFAENISSEQLAKLVTATWKQIPTSADIVVYSEINQKPLPVEKIRSLVEKAYMHSDQAAVRNTPSERKMEMDEEIERIIKEQQSSRVIKQQIFLDKHLMRVDETIVAPGEFLDDNTPVTRTIVNAGAPWAGDYTHFEYNHKNQIATVFNSKNVWRKRSIDDWIGLPRPAKILFQGVLGIPKEIDGRTILEPNPTLIKKAMNGELDSIKIRCESQQYNGSNVDRIVITARHAPDNPAMILLCDRNDYSLVYRIDVFNPKTGKPIYFRECDKFDEEGFPKSVNTIKYSSKDGTMLRSEKAAVHAVKLNTNIAKELFEFMVPLGYGMVDRRTDNPIAIMPYENYLGVLDDTESAGNNIMTSQIKTSNTDFTGDTKTDLSVNDTADKIKSVSPELQRYERNTPKSLPAYIPLVGMILAITFVLILVICYIIAKRKVN